MVYRVVIDRLPWICEPERRDTTRSKIQTRFANVLAQRDDNFADEIDEGCPTAMEALELLMTQQPCPGPWAFQMVYALELLCMYWGVAEENNRFSPTKWSYLGTLQERLAACVTPEPLTALLYGGPPVPLGVTALPDMPAVGHLRAKDIAAHLERAPDADGLPLTSEDDRVACRQLWHWMLNARADYERDLVAFTY
jgi:hypothetical protein